jgi:transposase, IS5 family
VKFLIPWFRLGIEVSMSQRRIGQEAFAFGSSGVGRRSSLDDLRDLIDWAPIERQLVVVSCSAKGELAWPPLALFKAMLLAMWYDPSRTCRT